MIVSPEFDQSIPNASTTARLGWCHGFEELGIPFYITSITELDKCLPLLHQPVCWLTEADYRYLTTKNMRVLKRFPHIVWVNSWFSKEERYYKLNAIPRLSSPGWVRKRVLESEPSFVFTISPVRSFEFYDQWTNQGLQLYSLPLAWDNTTYPDNPSIDPEFMNVEIAFVGGYWKYKAKQLDRYLKPYAARLTVFGYSRWPYGNYGGLLSILREGSLYRQAKVSPVINEPHVAMMGIDQNERVFKVLGSGGFAVTDVVEGYREWFSEDELIVPKDINQFHDMINLAIDNPEFSSGYRKRGQKAVLERHKYSHRARRVLEILNLKLE